MTKKRILLVEDDKFLLTALREVFVESDLDLTVAQDGVKGLDLINKGGYDLILLDLIMPALNGFEVLAKARKDTPIIVFSNLEDEENKEKAMGLGAKKYFVKSEIDIGRFINDITRELQ